MVPWLQGQLMVVCFPTLTRYFHCIQNKQLTNAAKTKLKFPQANLPIDGDIHHSIHIKINGSH